MKVLFLLLILFMLGQEGSVFAKGSGSRRRQKEKKMEQQFTALTKDLKSTKCAHLVLEDEDTEAETA